ncbi:hypothetical protein L6164_027363 [Bauhinia variegata]|uniref:Uncharacterized protein n=1 Tax=Bauhinia variegata TaxID=167791 RepID=A0ACB9LSR5_BAUVA|nr:hypothetical protein L6164_027363 [Bauhinia variegata]
MYQLSYKATKSIILRSNAPKEIKLHKHLLNIVETEERFCVGNSFSPGDGHEAKDPIALYTAPKELRKWTKIILDAYRLNKEETELMKARQMTQPIVIQRLFLLKENIFQRNA